MILHRLEESIVSFGISGNLLLHVVSGSVLDMHVLHAKLVQLMTNQVAIISHGLRRLGLLHLGIHDEVWCGKVSTYQRLGKRRQRQKRQHTERARVDKMNSGALVPLPRRR